MKLVASIILFCLSPFFIDHLKLTKAFFWGWVDTTNQKMLWIQMWMMCRNRKRSSQKMVDMFVIYCKHYHWYPKPQRTFFSTEQRIFRYFGAGFRRYSKNRRITVDPRCPCHPWSLVQSVLAQNSQTSSHTTLDQSFRTLFWGCQIPMAPVRSLSSCGFLWKQLVYVSLQFQR